MKRSGQSRATSAAVMTAAAVAGMWTAIHAVPGFGPAMADGVRKVAGPAPVAWAEDVVYGLEDRLKGALYHKAPPKKLWDAAPVPEAHAPAQEPIASLAPVAPAWTPARVAPPFAEVSASGDGEWIAIADPAKPNEPARMFKTSVHPDADRGYAVVAVVAMELSRVAIHMVPGTVEPATDEEIPARARPGIIPSAGFDDLIAAFNGGFKAEHGHFGMMVDGRTFLPARSTSCTVALYKDGGVRVRTWTAIRDTEGEMAGYRQTPPCLVEEGRVNDKLTGKGDALAWGVAVGQSTAIRRSAIGVDRARQTLFFAIGDSVTARAMAQAMKAAGAEDAAQLDVNAAFPRFLTYGKAKAGEAPRVIASLMPETPHVKQQYVGTREDRDFFYVTRR